MRAAIAVRKGVSMRDLLPRQATSLGRREFIAVRTCQRVQPSRSLLEPGIAMQSRVSSASQKG